MYLNVYRKVSEIKMSEKISSRLFTLAMASEWIGCIVNNSAARNAKSWFVRKKYREKTR